MIRFTLIHPFFVQRRSIITRTDRIYLKFLYSEQLHVTYTQFKLQKRNTITRAVVALYVALQPNVTFRIRSLTQLKLEMKRFG